MIRTLIFILAAFLWALPHASAAEEWKSSSTELDSENPAENEDPYDNPTFTGTYFTNGTTTIKQGTEIADYEALRLGGVSADALPLLTRHVVSSSGNGSVYSSTSYSSSMRQTESESDTDVQQGLTISKRK